MVKKFNEFIKEGFLSKTLNRAKTGEQRKGDIEICPDEKKYIELFLKENGWKTIEDGDKSNAMTSLKSKGTWDDMDFKTIMIIIGKLIELYPHVDFSGYWFDNNVGGFTCDQGERNISFLICKPQLILFYKSEQYNIKSPSDEKDFNRSDREYLIDKMVEKFKGIFSY